MQRAVYNQDVADKWAIIVGKHRRTYERYALVLFTIAIIGLILALLMHRPLFLILFGLGLLGAIFVRQFGTSRLKCPHCGLRPVHLRDSPLSADFCSNCHVWLKSPHASGSQGPV